MACPEEEQLKLEKLRLEVREMRSPWNRAGRWLPILIAIATVLINTSTLEARRTLNESKAALAELDKRNIPEDAQLRMVEGLEKLGVSIPPRPEPALAETGGAG